MLTKQQIFDFVKSGQQPQGFSQKTGRDAYLAAAGKVLDKVKEVNNVPAAGPKPRGE